MLDKTREDRVPSMPYALPHVWSAPLTQAQIDADIARAQNDSDEMRPHDFDFDHNGNWEREFEEQIYARHA